MDREDLTGKIIGCAMTVHSILGSGFLESVYQKALTYELRKAGLKADSKRPINVMYDGICVGDFEADILAEDCVILENKAVTAFATAHETQLVNYLTATGIDIGLLFNFGAARLEFKRKYRVFKKKETESTGD